MTGIRLRDVLNLVGRLDDAPGGDAPRQRFRRFLRESVTDVDQLAAYVGEAASGDTDQDARALQDLVNHAGRLLGFGVTFGPYESADQEVGFHGHWQSDDGSHIVVEVRAQGAELSTSSLVGSIYGLIAENRIRNWEAASGLYVLARDADRAGLERAIIADRRTERLRVVTVDGLIRLARWLEQGPLEHDDVRLVLGPARPDVEASVELISSRCSSRTAGAETEDDRSVDAPLGEPSRQPPVSRDRQQPRLLDYVDDVMEQLIDVLRPDRL